MCGPILLRRKGKKKEEKKKKKNPLYYQFKKWIKIALLSSTFCDSLGQPPYFHGAVEKTLAIL